MPGVARQGDSVNTIHTATGDLVVGDGVACDVAPIDIATDEASDNVFVNQKGVVRMGDNVEAHSAAGSCASHAPPLTEGSSSVFANGKAIGRIGDTYGCGAEITEASDNVYTN